MKVTLTKTLEFAAAQSLPTFPEGHKCRGLHGHTFIVDVSVTGEVDPESGIFYDFANISEAAAPLIDQLDHSYLNDIPGLEKPTTELMCAWFWEKLSPKLPGLSEIVIHESPRIRCAYRGPEA
ncbi:MAG: 6-carboxytetrahydropterin synthase QueD [Verrucomicrobiota bacterium]